MGRGFVCVWFSVMITNQIQINETKTTDTYLGPSWWKLNLDICTNINEEKRKEREIITEIECVCVCDLSLRLYVYVYGD